MSLKPRRVVVVYADNSYMGEQDYSAPNNQLNELAKQSDGYLTFAALKEYKKEDGTIGLKHLDVSEGLPITRNEIRTRKAINDDVSVDDFVGTLADDAQYDVIGFGNSTLKTVASLNQALMATKSDVNQKTYLTHLPQDIETVNENGIHIISTANKEKLVEAFGAEKTATTQLTTIKGMPNSYTRELCMEEYDKFTAAAAGTSLEGFTNAFDSGRPVVLVDMPAGFTLNGQHAPHLETEAFLNGMAMASKVDPDAAVLLVDGGNRNPKDKDAGQDTKAAYKRGYTIGMKARGLESEIYSEDYVDGMGHDSTKAILAMAMLRQEQTETDAKVTLSIAGEAAGIRAAAIDLIDNEKVEIGMVNFGALVTRKDPIGNDHPYIKYFQTTVDGQISGVYTPDQVDNLPKESDFKPENVSLHVERHPNQLKTPNAVNEESSKAILETVRLNENHVPAVYQTQHDENSVETVVLVGQQALEIRYGEMTDNGSTILHNPNGAAVVTFDPQNPAKVTKQAYWLNGKELEEGEFYSQTTPDLDVYNKALAKAKL